MRYLVCVAALSLCAVFVGGCNKPKPKATTDTKIVPDVTVTADQLLADYKANHIGADQKYKDKKVQITGKYAGTGNVALAGDYVGLGSAHEGEFDVMCFLEKDDPATTKKAASLKEGDSVTLVGVCEGKVLGFTAVRLKWCFFPEEKKQP
jgi:tRNA_anti-like